jgi:hypothetical protein
LNKNCTLEFCPTMDNLYVRCDKVDGLGLQPNNVNITKLKV